MFNLGGQGVQFATEYSMKLKKYVCTVDKQVLREKVSIVKLLQLVAYIRNSLNGGAL